MAVPVASGGITEVQKFRRYLKPSDAIDRLHNLLFGIRLALGAAGTDIVRLVTRYAVIVSSIGLALGLTLSYFGTRLIQSMLFGVSALDPTVYAAAVLTLTMVVALACVGPAWRAVRVQAVEVLRAE